MSAAETGNPGNSREDRTEDRTYESVFGDFGSPEPWRRGFVPLWSSVRRSWSKMAGGLEPALEGPVFTEDSKESMIKAMRGTRNFVATHGGYKGAEQDLQSMETLRKELRRRERLQRLCANRADISPGLMKDVQQNLEAISGAAGGISATGMSRLFMTGRHGAPALDRGLVSNLAALGQEARNIDPFGKSPDVGSRIYKKYADQLDKMQETMDSPELLKSMRVQAGHERTKALVGKHWQEHPQKNLQKFQASLQSLNFSSSSKGELQEGLEMLSSAMSAGSGVFSMIWDHTKALIRISAVPAWAWTRYGANRTCAVLFDQDETKKGIRAVLRKIRKTEIDPVEEIREDEFRKAGKRFSRSVMAAPRSLRARLQAPQSGWLGLVRSGFVGEGLYRRIFHQKSGIGLQARDSSMSAVRNPERGSSQRWLRLLESCIRMDPLAEEKYEAANASGGNSVKLIRDIAWGVKHRDENGFELSGKQREELAQVAARVRDPESRAKLESWQKSNWEGLSGVGGGPGAVETLTGLLRDPLEDDMKRIIRLGSDATERSSLSEGAMEKLSKSFRTLDKTMRQAHRSMSSEDLRQQTQASQVADLASQNAQAQNTLDGVPEEESRKQAQQEYEKAYQTERERQAAQPPSPLRAMSRRFIDPDLMAVMAFTSVCHTSYEELRKSTTEVKDFPETRMIDTESGEVTPLNAANAKTLRPAELLAEGFNSLPDEHRREIAGMVDPKIILGEGVTAPPSEENGFRVDPRNPEQMAWLGGTSELLQKFALTFVEKGGQTDLAAIHADYADKAPEDWRAASKQKPAQEAQQEAQQEAKLGENGENEKKSSQDAQKAPGAPAAPSGEETRPEAAMPPGTAPRGPQDGSGSKPSQPNLKSKKEGEREERESREGNAGYGGR